MYLMLSWEVGERPHLDFLPITDDISMLKIVIKAAQEGRSIEVYIAQGDKLELLYPDAETVSLAAKLIPK